MTRKPYVGLATTFDTAAELYERARPHCPQQQIPARDAEAMAASGFFAQPVVHRYVWSQEYTAEQYLAVLSTYSNHIAASPQRRETLFARIRNLIAARPSATVRKHHLNTLQIARRRD